MARRCLGPAARSGGCRPTILLSRSCASSEPGPAAPRVNAREAQPGMFSPLGLLWLYL